ncbi:hypothetical protein VNI00_013494 [Paramarasmius palmivorus]|uniref:Uncharacterized protein n=1 Tax=Paramarasmius palmivorus TaxID=297713 RepID=A0AAW0BXY1_9AGAR
MPRQRLYKTSAERKKAHAQSSLKWYHKNKEKVNAQRRKREHEQQQTRSTTFGGLNTAGMTEERTEESADDNVGCSSASPQASDVPVNRKSAVVCTPVKKTPPTISTPNKTEIRYWQLKIAKIEHAFALVGAGSGVNKEYLQSAYHLAISCDDDTQAYEALDKLHSRLEKLVSYCYTCQTRILEYIGLGETLDSLLDLKTRIQTRKLLTADLACIVLSGGIAELTSECKKGHLAFQKQ